MTREQIINHVPHVKLLEIFISFATRELGTMKMNEIISKVNSSKKIKLFLQKAKVVNQPLGSDDYLGCLHSSTNFMFANAEIISVAAISLLIKWNHEIGNPNFLCDDIHLNNRFFTLIEQCSKYKIHIKSGPNFFDRFYDYLASEINKYLSDLIAL